MAPQRRTYKVWYTDAPLIVRVSGTGAAARTTKLQSCKVVKLQKKAPNVLKSLDAELK
jgi:hypothetical protein